MVTLYPATDEGRVRSAVDDNVLEGLAQGVTGKLGGKVGVAPRIFLKRLVDVLDRVEEHPDFVPARDYELVVSPEEMKAEEREAAGVTRSVDDIELDLG